MCVSIVFGVNLANGKINKFTENVYKLGRAYDYGIGMGRESLLPGAEEAVVNALAGPDVVFEVHDPPEPHCACDIDNDIRTASKLGRRSRFFDFVREVIGLAGVRSVTILFFQEELPDMDNLREQYGSYADFVEVLNRWNTWQVEGFEPTRRAYYIADAAPLLFTFTDRKFSQ